MVLSLAGNWRRNAPHSGEVPGRALPAGLAACY